MSYRLVVLSTIQGFPILQRYLYALSTLNLVRTPRPQFSFLDCIECMRCNCCYRCLSVSLSVRQSVSHVAQLGGDCSVCTVQGSFGTAFAKLLWPLVFLQTAHKNAIADMTYTVCTVLADDIFDVTVQHTLGCLCANYTRNVYVTTKTPTLRLVQKRVTAVKDGSRSHTSLT